MFLDSAPCAAAPTFSSPLASRFRQRPKSRPKGGQPAYRRKLNRCACDAHETTRVGDGRCAQPWIRWSGVSCGKRTAAAASKQAGRLRMGSVGSVSDSGGRVTRDDVSVCVLCLCNDCELLNYKYTSTVGPYSIKLVQDSGAARAFTAQRPSVARESARAACARSLRTLCRWHRPAADRNVSRAKVAQGASRAAQMHKFIDACHIMPVRRWRSWARCNEGQRDRTAA